MTLEQLGINDPSQEQIDVMEAVILLCLSPQHLTDEKTQLCFGENNIAKRVFLHQLKKILGEK